jgi:regulatory protein
MRIDIRVSLLLLFSDAVAMIDKSIYDKLTNYCAYQERCAEDVRQKLQKLKEDKGNYADYITLLREDNFLNDERYVKAFIAGHEKKKWGKTKMKMALLGKRIDSTLIKQYLDEMDERDYDEQIKVIAERKWNTIKAKSPRDKKTKLLRFLLSKGYEMNKALHAMKQLEL